ncbi:fragmin60 [Pholiota conissans]|uniref:Fragmin60 n=1 Tax=Pholiota conissans TaxID=109636 RepID=A0A9P5Z8M6_9AGAR|nr:fragmin60 [Pholiota conissans]
MWKTLTSAYLVLQLEKRVREESGEEEESWKDAGKEVGIQIWRIEKFHVVPWPKERYGSFYDGDSYIILHTYKKTSDAKSFSYDLHFWLGQNTTQDEAGTAAYKTVELDDFLHGKPVQSRECQGYESVRFLSYFPRFLSLQGGVSTGFHHVSDPIPSHIRKLYRITFTKSASGQSHLVVREVPAITRSLVEGDVYVLDKGNEIFQLNTKSSSGQERFKAAEFVQNLVNERESQSDVTVFDEGGSGVGRFFAEFGQNVSLRKADATANSFPTSHLYRITDATGVLIFEALDPASKETLTSDDAFLVDDSGSASHPAIYVWIGNGASLNERRLSLQYAQRYLYDKSIKIGEPTSRVHVAIPIIKLQEGEETPEFLEAM